MLRFALSRLALGLAVTFTISLVTFLLLNVSTDPAAALAGPDADEATIQQVRKKYGFDRPLLVQYGGWLAGLLSGNLGASWFWRTPVLELIAHHAPVTIKLALSAVLVTVLVAFPLGTAAALRPNSWIDRVALGTAVAAQAIPSFWFGLVLIMVFSVELQMFPVSGDSTWQHFVLPAGVLGLLSVPSVMRLIRSGLLEVLGADYIRTARAKGLRERQVLVHHAMRNALLPVVSVLAVQLGGKLGGSVITESVFALNGLGRLALHSVLAADIPTLQMLVLVFAITFVLLTFVADLLNGWIDPRIRLG